MGVWRGKVVVGGADCGGWARQEAEDDAYLGRVYCDLEQRPGKPLGAAHYTIQW
jgi:hypothetical protein